MANKYYGVGVKWGIGTTGMTGSGITTFQPEKVGIKRSAKKEEIAGGDGNTAGLVYYDHKKEITITVKPSAATLALAKTVNVTPDPGTKITFVDTTDAEIAGDWIVDDSSKDTTNTGASVINITASQYATAGVQTEVTS